MARVRRFFKIKQLSSSLHPTEVDCGYAAVDVAGKRYLQLNTYGSDDRADPGTVSQTLQLDRSSATRLRDLVERVFDL
jgi:hypothetical protein